MTDPSMLAKQSSVDDKIEEARSLLPPAALQSASIRARALRRPRSPSCSGTGICAEHVDQWVPAICPGTIRFCWATSGLCFSCGCAAPKKSVRSASSTRSLRSSAASTQSEKRPISQVADAEEEDRPVVRPRTEQDGQAQSRTPAAVTAAVKTALTPSQSVMPTPTPAVLIPDATTTQDQRSLTTVAATSRVKTQDA
ncbi:unnamed protein product [Tilletia laevis]|uniref:Uncharacterized protein n=1 Tax=Tilletia caries TaxID=13290 RepID=A0A8T8SJS6_9BASI|nr:hypothetical protein CF335_g7218 [Tilletia laevis]KAE8241272.1 hypothetical protein A4X03_0g8184 [Tilletia caries]CAD6959391.1 unnamed protein product [Tilletia controversa]CAD6889425.1 unnamed protein product [Tilletia caries]CAD6953040.1 unnamed protein product [Tilletia laevis]